MSLIFCKTCNKQVDTDDIPYDFRRNECEYHHVCEDVEAHVSAAEQMREAQSEAGAGKLSHAQ